MTSSTARHTQRREGIEFVTNPPLRPDTPQVQTIIPMEYDSQMKTPEIRIIMTSFIYFIYLSFSAVILHK